MSAEIAVRAAVLAALRGDAALMAIVNGVYDGPPVKASEPYALVGDGAGSDWGTKDADGREVRIAINLFDRQETPVRLGEIMALSHGVMRGFGALRWMSGANCGIAQAVVACDAGSVTLADPPPFPVVAGTRVLLTEGCDKRMATCSGRFGNAANFRGEPYLPGNDLLTRYPGG